MYPFVIHFTDKTDNNRLKQKLLIFTGVWTGQMNRQMGRLKMSMTDYQKPGTWQCRTRHWRTKSQRWKMQDWQWRTNAATNARSDITLNAEYRQKCVCVFVCCYSGVIKQSIVVTTHYCVADKQILANTVSLCVQKYCIDVLFIKNTKLWRQFPVTVSCMSTVEC